MAIVFQDATFTNTTPSAATELDADKSGSLTSGDFELLVAVNANNTSTAQFVDNLTNWTFVDTVGDSTTDTHIGVYWRFADGSANDKNEAVPQQANLKGVCVRMRYTGVNATPIHKENFQATVGGSDTHDILGVTTTVDACEAIAILGVSRPATSYSYETGWTKRGDTDEANASGVAVGTLDGGKDPAGATGTCTVTTGTSQKRAFVQIALLPAVASGSRPQGPLGHPFNGPFGGPL